MSGNQQTAAENIPPSLERVLEDFQQALAQWRMFSEDSESRDLETDNDTEAKLYRRCRATLDGLKASAGVAGWLSGYGDPLAKAVGR